MEDDVIFPMRPGMNLGPVDRGFVIPGWEWQPKINDERAILRVGDGVLFNRHKKPFDRHKAHPFAEACGELCRMYAGHRFIDLGLIGYRDSDTFKVSRGAVIVFDLPGHDGEPYVARRQSIRTKIPALDLVAGERAVPGMVYRLEDEPHGGELFHRTEDVAGLEGIVGRLLAGPYVTGEARTMAKSRWLRA